MRDCSPQTSHAHTSEPPHRAPLPGSRGAANDTAAPIATGIAGKVRLTWRAPLVFGAVLGAVGEPIVRRTTPETTVKVVQRWARTILAIAGVQVSVKGQPPEGIGLFVCNHRSYVDILALLSCVPVGFLCKKEVANWPLIGSVATRMGAVFVDRNNKQSRSSTLNSIAEAVLDAKSIVAFPEGTTHSGPGMGATRPGLFRIAETRNFALFPMIIEYDDPHDAWVGDDTLLRHVLWWLSKPSSKVTMSFGTPVLPVAAGAPLHTQRIVEAWMRNELEVVNQRDSACGESVEFGTNDDSSLRESGTWSKR